MEALKLRLKKLLPALMWLMVALITGYAVLESHSPGGLMIWMFGFALIVSLAPDRDKSFASAISVT